LTAADREEILRVKLDYAEKQSDRLQKTIQWLVTISGLYAVILGLYAYFGLNRLVDGAQKEIDKTAKTFEEERQRLQEERDRSYPIVTRIERNLSATVEQIERILPAYEERDWVRDLYSDLDAEQREQVLMSEASIASFEVLGLGGVSLYSSRVALIYGRLGRFYGSRYAKRRKDGGRDRPDPSEFEGDRARAIEYLEKAIAADAGKAVLHRDLGVLLAQGHKADSLTRAESAYRKALSCDPNDPGARFNLATRWMKDHSQKAADSFRSLARDLEKLPDGEASKAKYLWGCFFQLACLDQTPPVETRTADALENLRRARKEAMAAHDLKGFLQDLENDLRPEESERAAGDLYLVGVTYPREVEQLRRAV
jgi:tetratricopeptide (TPR) repeat protein